MSSRVGVVDLAGLSDFLDASQIISVTELPSVNIICGFNQVSGDFVAVSSITGDCAITTAHH